MLLVTGGAGFIGSNFVLDWLRVCGTPVITLDKLTYAGNRENLSAVAGDGRHRFVHGDICDDGLVSSLLDAHRPEAVVHLAAETHVDRSILGADAFIQTNVVGTHRLLESVRRYWMSLPAERQLRFRFLHVSTDEVYGSLGPAEAPFSEERPYRPNSPYAASKAAADHLVRACHETHGLPTLTTNCSNNYGPFQFPEKLIPLMIVNALAGKPLPLYGDGMNIRDWLFVGDHCSAIRAVLARGRVGETYNIGGSSERPNLDIVGTVCRLLDELTPDGVGPRERLIVFVPDRPGHDRRYAMDTTKIERELGWRAQETLESGLLKTVEWYLDNQAWVQHVMSGEYRAWIDVNYGARSGNSRQ
ncbi:MAG: dTDP-glucose 4,6-dehydratase [Acidobacteriota bacterium]